MKRLRSHPWYLTRTNILASCAHGFKNRLQSMCYKGNARVFDPDNQASDKKNDFVLRHGTESSSNSLLCLLFI
jgi:hypothetical protein